MCADLYIALLGLFRVGAIAVFLDPSAGADHIERCCERIPPVAFLGIPKAHLLRLKSKALRKIPLKITTRYWVPGAQRWLQNASDPALRESLAVSEDAALVTFTSGSTGVPKATVRTHEFLLAQYQVLAPNISLEAGEVDLATLPVFVLASLAAGVATVIPDVDLRSPGSVNASAIFAQVERHRVTRITASPAFFERLIEFNRSTGRTLPTVTKIFTGGAPVFPRVLAALTQLAPNAQIESVYGSTEAEPIAHIGAEAISPADLEAMKRGQGLLAGTPVRGVQLAILRDEWGQARQPLTLSELQSLQLKTDEIGEIVVSGAHVLRGYLDGVGDAETKFLVDGQVWHRTGDAGALDANGRLWLHGRCAAKIPRAAGPLYPLGIETIATMFPHVVRAAVVSHQGKRALIVAGDIGRPMLNSIQEAVRVAGIEHVVAVDRLPVDRRHNAKIDYPELHKMLTRRDKIAG
jgi:acyl-CoA synthetase (AMP-forming)/AMP-acid ligase II